MNTNETDDFKITNTDESDWNAIIWLFEKVIRRQAAGVYRVWDKIDEIKLKSDIKNRLHYKIVRNDRIIGIFSVQYSDPFIWRERDKGDAVYLHRIAADPACKGEKQFAKVLNWARRHALDKNLEFIRMDTWADNTKIIDYYKSFGFEFIENYVTPDEPELPLQNRNLNVALLEMNLSKPQ